MSTKLWFHLANVLTLTEHALSATEHCSNPSAHPGQHSPALVCVVGNGIRLASSGTQPVPPMPVFAEGHPIGSDHRYRAGNGIHLPDGATLLPLTTAAAGQRSLADRVRSAAARGCKWLSVDLTAPEPVVAFHTDPPEAASSAVEWMPALVAIDDLLGPYPAQVMAGRTWNGWAIPRFSREVAQRIAEDTQRLATSVTLGHVDVVRIVGDRVEVAHDVGTVDEDVEVVDADPDGLYRVGAMSWTWSVVDASAAECLDECRCGTGCGCPDRCAACAEPVDAGHSPQCPWTAGSAPYEQPEIPPQPAVLDAHRHRPGCPLVRRRPGPLFTDADVQRCGFCGDTGCLNAHTLHISGGRVEHHQRCTSCGETWSAAGPASAA